MRILGIDPGTRRMGAAIVRREGSRYRAVHWEVIQPKESLPVPDRLHYLHQALQGIISRYSPEVLVLEKVFYHKDIRASLRIGEARACAMLAASGAGLDVVEYAATSVKKSVSGNGRASKEQVQHMVKVLLGLGELPPTDAADALAAAICHLHHGASCTNTLPVS